MSERKRELARIKPAWEGMWRLYLEDHFIELLAILDIRHFDSQMLVARHDNEAEMQVVKNALGKASIDNWDGDMLTMYAKIEVEKELAGVL